MEIESNLRKKRREANAPCSYEAWDDLKRKDVTMYPPIRCDLECSRCGWNPEVQARRIEKLKQNLQKKKGAIA